MKRKSFTNAILRKCEEFGDRSWREKLGIKAAVRAQFFHRGKEDPVSFDSIKDLSQKGSDLLLIEKEGVAEILEPYASKRGVAVLNTRGFAVEYAKQIMEDAKAQLRKRVPANRLGFGGSPHGKELAPVPSNRHKRFYH